MYYRYAIVEGNIYKLTGEKSSSLLDGSDVVYCQEDIDLQRYDVTVGHIVNGVMLRHTKKLKSMDVVVDNMVSLYESQANYAIDLDYRLSKLELGL